MEILSLLVLAGILALLFVGLVLGTLFFGMRFYYPDEHPTDNEKSSAGKGAKTKRP